MAPPRFSSANCLRCFGGFQGNWFFYFLQIYNRINDKVVGLLIRARKKSLLTFEGEMLYQGKDDETWVILTKSINTIRVFFGREGDLAAGGEVDSDVIHSRQGWTFCLICIIVKKGCIWWFLEITFFFCRKILPFTRGTRPRLCWKPVELRCRSSAIVTQTASLFVLQTQARPHLLRTRGEINSQTRI